MVPLMGRTSSSRVLWSLAFSVAAALAGCRSDEKPAPPPPAPELPVTAPGDLRLPLGQLAIAAVLVADLSTNADRPAGFSAPVEDVVREGWKAPSTLAWAPDRPAADGGFEVRAAYVVQLLDGDEPRPAATEGVVYVAVRVEAERRVRGVTAELYREEARAEVKWESPAPVGPVVEAALRDVTARAKAAVEARIQAHHADDATLIATITGSKGAERAEAAVEAGERRLTAAVPALIEALQADGPDDVALVEQVAATLGRLGDERGVRPLARLTSRNDPDVLRAAVYALGDIGTPLARRYLTEIAESHAHGTVRTLAREVLDRLPAAP